MMSRGNIPIAQSGAIVRTVKQGKYTSLYGSSLGAPTVPGLLGPRVVGSAYISTTS